MTRSTVLLWLAHATGNAVLLGLGYYWLGLSEADGIHFAWSAAVIAAVGCGALWLHGTGLAYFAQQEPRRAATAGRTALRHLLPLIALAVVALALYAAVGYWRDSFGHSAFTIGSYATMRLRKPVPPSGVLRVFYGLIWLLRWVVLPVILFPVAADVAVSGWRGFGLAGLRKSKRVLYWVETAALTVCAFSVPFRLESWIPKVEQFSMQLASLGVRLGLGYLLFVSALLALEFFTSAGRPRLSQSNTVAVP